MSDLLRILVVEDNPADADLIQEMLPETGPVNFQFELVSRLSEALIRLKRQGIDLVLLDLGLPDSPGGLPTLHQLRAAEPDVPVIVMTGTDDQELAVAAVRSGAQDYLIKGQVGSNLLARAVRYARERKLAEQALIQEHDLLRTVIDNIPDQVYLKDPDSRFLSVNLAAAQFFGAAAPDAIIGKCDFDFFSRDQAAQFLAEEQALLHCGQSCVNREASVTDAAGNRRWILTTKVLLRDHTGNITGLLGINRDITWRKQAEVEQQRSYQTQAALNALLSISLQEIPLEEFLLQVIDQILTIPWLALEAKGAIFMVEADPFTLVLKAQRNLSASVQAACGRVPFGRCLCGRAAAAGKPEFAECVDDRHEIRYAGLTPHGHYCMPIVSAGRTLGVINLYVKADHPWEPQEEKFLSAVANVVGGIIQRKQAADRLQQAHAELTGAHAELKATQLHLIEAAKLESVGQLAAGVAHEVKNPLAIALMGLEYVASTVVTTDAQVAVVLQDIKDAILRADEIVRELLDFSAPTNLDLELQDLNAVVARVLNLIRYEVEKRHVTSKIELGPDLPPLQLDRIKIEQTLLNLCLNAIEAMPAGGTLLVKTGAHHLATGATEVSVEVADTGPGIPEEDLARIFDPFFTKKPVGKGTGLGLTVARRIIDLHSGTLRIDNRPAGGVRATITFKPQGEPPCPRQKS